MLLWDEEKCKGASSSRIGGGVCVLPSITHNTADDSSRGDRQVGCSELLKAIAPFIYFVELWKPLGFPFKAQREWQAWKIALTVVLVDWQERGYSCLRKKCLGSKQGN